METEDKPTPNVTSAGWRFSLRELLLLLTTIAAVLGWYRSLSLEVHTQANSPLYSQLRNLGFVPSAAQKVLQDKDFAAFSKTFIEHTDGFMFVQFAGKERFITFSMREHGDKSLSIKDETVTRIRQILKDNSMQHAEAMSEERHEFQYRYQQIRGVVIVRQWKHTHDDGFSITVFIVECSPK